MSDSNITFSESARQAAEKIRLYMEQQDAALQAQGYPPQPDVAMEVATDTAADPMAQMAAQMADIVPAAGDMAGHEPSFFITGLTVFVLSCIVGYYVVWRVTPALHSPLMGITNAISSVIIVGALMAAGSAVGGFSSFLGFLAVVLASINIFGGFIITRRMLHMFKKKA